MGQENCGKQHVDEVNGACYGKQNLYKVPMQDEYRGVCEYECRLKNECISASRENRENVNLALGYAKLDNGGSVIPGFGGSGGSDYITDTLGVKEEFRTEFVTCLDRLAGLYFNTPQIFENLMRKIYHDQKQSDVARMRGITRQAVSSQTLKNYAGIIADLVPELPRTLTGIEERTVYMLLWVDRASIREAAKKSGISASKIWRVKRQIASKLAKIGTGGEAARRKKGKK